MKQLLNTLFVTSEDVYLALDGENVTANRSGNVVARYPLHTLNSIISFSYSGASPALMGACAERSIGLSFCTPRGKFLARVCGESHGNVLLRKEQYRISDDPTRSCNIAKYMLFGKLYNERKNIERTKRDHAMRIDETKLSAAVESIKLLMANIDSITDLDTLRGIEGSAAKVYFSVFDELIINTTAEFTFHGRSRRPPLDRVNALMSFAYTLLAHDCASALESVGLDSYVGFLHRDRPGRTSLALDLMEELRPCVAERFVLTQINNRTVSKKDFEVMESGAVIMTDTARKNFLQAWQAKKKETLEHPFLHEKMPWGMMPYVQALLLARHIRGDIDAYPTFLCK